MKILYGLIFIVILFLISILGAWVQNSLIRKTVVRNTGLFSEIIGNMLITILMFLGFWVLTKSEFPFKIVLVILALSLIAQVVNEIMLAIAGVAIKEKRLKARILNSFMAFRQTSSSSMNAVGILILSILPWVSWIAVLVIYFSRPLGDPWAHSWIVMLVFLVPPLMVVAIYLFQTVPVMVSEYIDDDLRNTHLCTNLAAILSLVAACIFPYLIVRSSGEFTWLPSFWVVTSCTLIFFLLLYVIPFFIGAYNYRTRRANFLHHLKDILGESRDILHAPIADSEKREKLDQKIAEIASEIREREEDSKSYKVFAVLTAPQDGDSAHSKLVAFLGDHVDDLARWDKEIASIKKLEQIKEFLGSDNFPDLKTFIESKIKEYDSKLGESNNRKNILVGGISTTIVAAGTFVFTNYHKEMATYINENFQWFN